MPLFIQSNGFLTACRNTAADCIIFLTVGNSWLRQQTSKVASLYINYHWASAGMTKAGKQAVRTKAECFKAWRLFLLSSLFLSNIVTHQAWGQYDWIYGQIPFFLHFVRLSKSPLFFSWLVMPLCSLAARPPSPVATKNKTDNNIITAIMIKSLFTNSDYNKSS